MMTAALVFGESALTAPAMAAAVETAEKKIKNAL
jgi:hypothetical protein